MYEIVKIGDLLSRNPQPRLVRTDGLRSVQAGLGPALCYQFVMNGLRLGTFALMERRGWVRDTEGRYSLAR